MQHQQASTNTTLNLLGCPFRGHVQVKDLEAELERVSRENKELRGMLHAMSSNYHTLQAQARRIKKEMEAGTDSCSTDQYSARGPGTEPSRPKTSRVYVRTEANDSTLVLKLLIPRFCLIWNR